MIDAFGVARLKEAKRDNNDTASNCHGGDDRNQPSATRKLLPNIFLAPDVVLFLRHDLVDGIDGLRL